MSKPRIYLATPCHDRRVHMQYHASVLALMHSGLAEFTVCAEGGGGVAMARNNQAHEFLTKTKCEYMLSIDSDLGFQPGMVKRLLDHDRDFVAATYSLKQTGRQLWACEELPGVELSEADALWPMLAVGGGFQLVRREVYERMTKTFPETYYYEPATDTWRWDLYANGVVRDDLYGPNPRYLTEDWYFCYRAIKCGYTVWMDRSFYPTHYGDAAFPLIPAA